MEKKFYSLRPVKVEKKDSTNSIPYLPAADRQKNYHWPMQNTVLIPPMANRSPWCSVRRWAATGNATGADGKPIYRSSILQTKNPKLSAKKPMQAMNFLCGMVMPFIFYPIEEKSYA